MFPKGGDACACYNRRRIAIRLRVGKGNLLGKLIKDQDWDAFVRVGAPNAGHTAIVDGRKVVATQLPLGAFFEEHPQIILGRGAVIYLPALQQELDMIRQRDLEPHILVDEECHVIQSYHVQREANGSLQRNIGSTSATAGKGIGACEQARLARDDGEAVLACQSDELRDMQGIHLIDTVAYLSKRQYDEKILVEGTQGYGLSLYHGIWPYVTSRDTTVSGILAQIGLAPDCLTKTYGVARTFPIRVAGNSGPFWPGSEELSWEENLAEFQPEVTTVTKKRRRIATFSTQQVERALISCGRSAEMMLSFVDYIDSRGEVIKAVEEAELEEFIGSRQLEDWLIDNFSGHLLESLRWISIGPGVEDIYRVRWYASIKALRREKETKGRGHG